MPTQVTMYGLVPVRQGVGSECHVWIRLIVDGVPRQDQVAAWFLNNGGFQTVPFQASLNLTAGNHTISVQGSGSNMGGPDASSYCILCGDFPTDGLYAKCHATVVIPRPV